MTGINELWDKFQEECGVFGVYGCKDAAKLCYLGLYALQHRGQEGAGIVSSDGVQFYVVKNMGLVSDIFNPENMSYLKGDAAIGHVRYSTSGGSSLRNVQPLYTGTAWGKIALAHNGNLTNAHALYNRLNHEGALFQSTSDTEMILHLYSRSKSRSKIARIDEALSQVEGAYSLCFLGEDFLVAARDPYGFRPLVLGKLNEGYVVSSETCALDLIGATYVREIEPGEMICIDENGLTSHKLKQKSTRHAFCVFEHVYFARPDSVLFGDCVHDVRKAFGARLAQEHPVEADCVIAIPDSGNSAALGYAEASGIPYEIGITRNHYVGRTFIQPSQKIRDFGVKVKLNPIRSIIEGKRLVVVDDSIVRGTTSRARVKALRDAGAKEIHFRISSPPVLGPCHFGIDTPKREKLIASQKSLEEIRRFVGADSLGYLSMEGMLAAIKSVAPEQFCTGCFTQKYPLRVNKGRSEIAVETRNKRIKLYK